MRIRIPISAALAVCMALSRAAFAADPAVATVNGVAIPQDIAELLVAEQRASGTSITPEVRGAIREELVRREVVVQEAKRLGVDQLREVVLQAEIARQSIVVRAMLQSFAGRNPPTEEEVTAAYENLKSQAGTTEYRVRSILLEREDEAAAVIDALKKGGKFEEQVRRSRDRASAERGGDLGWVNRATLIKPLSDAVIALAKGAYSPAPVRSQIGFHVLLVDDVRPIVFPPRDQMRVQLAQQVLQAKFGRYVSELRAKAKVE